jgi:hypothetical protein
LRISTAASALSGTATCFPRLIVNYLFDLSFFGGYELRRAALRARRTFLA